MGRWDHPPGQVGAGNQPRGRNPFTWDQFHALPRVLRDILNYAPTALGSWRAYEALMLGSDIRAVARQEVELARRFARADTLHRYGPSHPAVDTPAAPGPARDA